MAPTRKAYYGLEPAAFAPSAVAESTRRDNAAFFALLRDRPPLMAGSPASHRAAERAGGSLFASSDDVGAETIVIRGPAGDIDVRVFRGPACGGVYVHFHGGGWVLGGAAMQDQQLQHMANAAGWQHQAAFVRAVMEPERLRGHDERHASAET